MLTVYRRHQSRCPHSKKANPREHTKCLCPVWVQGCVGDRYLKEALQTRDWNVAQFKVREIEAAIFLPKAQEEPKRVTVKESIEKFFADARARNLSEATLYKYTILLERQLMAYCTRQHIIYIDQLDTEHVREFRATWRESAISGLKKLERLRAFCRFGHDSGWMKSNPAVAVKPPKVDFAPTEPFTDEEFEKILWACELFSTNGRYRAQNRTRVRALVLLLRYSGMRIGDATTLTKDKIHNGTLFLYTAKTGTPVRVPLPQMVLEELEKLPDPPFWNGTGKLTSAVGVWERTLKRLFEIAGLKGGHAHRFRDTFAVELLKRGTPLESVSVLLGHSSPAVTAKHYNPWVQSRQALLEQFVKDTWSGPAPRST
jgi:integrase